jgi:hypothetical protein
MIDFLLVQTAMGLFYAISFAIASAFSKHSSGVSVTYETYPYF